MARTHASWTTSSASCASRVSQRARLYAASRCGRTYCSKRWCSFFAIKLQYLTVVEFIPKGISRRVGRYDVCSRPFLDQEIPMTSIYLHLTSRLLCAVIALAVATGAAAAGPQAYVGNFKDNTVSVIDTGTGTVIATLPVANGPHGMTQTPDGRTVYISGDNSSEVSVIDTATNRVTHTIDVGKTPHGVAMTPDGRT